MCAAKFCSRIFCSETNSPTAGILKFLRRVVMDHFSPLSLINTLSSLWTFFNIPRASRWVSLQCWEWCWPSFKLLHQCQWHQWRLSDPVSAATTLIISVPINVISEFCLTVVIGNGRQRPKNYRKPNFMMSLSLVRHASSVSCGMTRNLYSLRVPIFTRSGQSHS